MSFNILIVGIGGMGIVTIGNLFKEFAVMNDQIDFVKVAESRGVSQREGSVYVSVKYILKDPNCKSESEIFISPQPEIGSVDLMMALEPLEFLRSAQFLKDKTTVLLNLQENIPKSTLHNDKISYPDITKKIHTIETLFPHLNLIKNNYTQRAITQYQKSIMANKLILEELPILFPKLFGDAFLDLINRIF